MPVVHLRDLLDQASRQGYAVAAFDLAGLDLLQGVVDAAERRDAPVVLRLDAQGLNGPDLAVLMPAVEQAARRAAVPVAIELHRAGGCDSAVQGINLGCNGVLVDDAGLTRQEYLSRTREVATTGRGCGVPVGAWLSVPGGDVDALRKDAVALVVETGVDFASVAAGGADQSVLATLSDALDIPLALAAADEASDEQLRQRVGWGIAKLDFGPLLQRMASQAARAATEDHSDFADLGRRVRAAVAERAAAAIDLSGSAGQAPDARAACREWLPVEHLIVYNVEGLDETGVAAMMAEGRQVLAAIPGVREVVTGVAVTNDPAYRYCWVVRFCHPAVIDSYRDHPDHVAFANQLFRPVAGGRVSIDYQAVEPPVAIKAIRRG